MTVDAEIEAKVVTLFRNGNIAIDKGKMDGVRNSMTFIVDVPSLEIKDEAGAIIDILTSTPLEFRVATISKQVTVLAPLYPPDYIKIGLTARRKSTLNRFTSGWTQFRPE